MNYTIRQIRVDEYPLLKEFTYQALFNRDPDFVIPKEVLEQQELKVYYENFGQKDDHGLVAIVNNQVVGAVWVRILDGEVKGFGNINSTTPEFAISLLPEYRNYGIGTNLMRSMLEELKKFDYSQTSLAVQKDNYALKMYQAVGFHIEKELEEEYLMLFTLK